MRENVSISFGRAAVGDVLTAKGHDHTTREHATPEVPHEYRFSNCSGAKKTRPRGRLGRLVERQQASITGSAMAGSVPQVWSRVFTTKGYDHKTPIRTLFDQRFNRYSQLYSAKAGSVPQVWSRVESALQMCRKGEDGSPLRPCVRWTSFDRGYGGPGSEQAVRKTTPTLDYAETSARCAFRNRCRCWACGVP